MTAVMVVMRLKRFVKENIGIVRNQNFAVRMASVFPADGDAITKVLLQKKNYYKNIKFNNYFLNRQTTVRITQMNYTVKDSSVKMVPSNVLQVIALHLISVVTEIATVVICLMKLIVRQDFREGVIVQNQG
jgi:hypothetical protein